MVGSENRLEQLAFSVVPFAFSCLMHSQGCTVEFCGSTSSSFRTHQPVLPVLWQLLLVLFRLAI